LHSPQTAKIGAKKNIPIIPANTPTAKRNKGCSTKSGILDWRDAIPTTLLGPNDLGQASNELMSEAHDVSGENRQADQIRNLFEDKETFSVEAWPAACPCD
jgi:hypothetical protein